MKLIPERKNEDAYNQIPLKARILIRLIIWILHPLNNMLKKHELSPYFCIYDISEEEEMEEEEQLH